MSVVGQTVKQFFFRVTLHNILNTCSRYEERKGFLFQELHDQRSDIYALNEVEEKQATELVNYLNYQSGVMKYSLVNLPLKFPMEVWRRCWRMLDLGDSLPQR